MTMNDLDRWVSCNPYIERPPYIEGIPRETAQRCGIDYRAYSEKRGILRKFPTLKMSYSTLLLLLYFGKTVRRR